MIIKPGFGEPKCTNMDEVVCVRMDSKKWGIMTKAVVLMLILLIPRTVIDFYGLDVVPINTVVGAFISGAIFTIAIIFTGTFTDFKESEKVGGDLAASLKALYNDSRVLPLADETPARVLTSPCTGSSPHDADLFFGKYLEPAGYQPGDGQNQQ